MTKIAMCSEAGPDSIQRKHPSIHGRGGGNDPATAVVCVLPASFSLPLPFFDAEDDEDDDDELLLLLLLLLFRDRSFGDSGTSAALSGSISAGGGGEGSRGADSATGAGEARSS